MFDLTGKVALVTGGNGGIGLAMARGLVEHGAQVMLTGRSVEKGQAAVAALGEASAFIAADIADPAAAETLVAATEAQWGRLDILINNAGMSVRKRPELLSLDEWNQVLNTNLTATFVGSQAAHPAMQRAGGGKIINIGSMLSIFGAAFAAAYGASKGGVVQLTRSLATAWAADNIQVNAVRPVWIDTELTVAAREQVDGLLGKVQACTPAGC